MPTSPDPLLWFRRFRPVERPRMRLVCLPHAGGAASAFRGWAPRLPPGVELLAGRFPGRQDRLGEPCIDTMSGLADAVTGALLPLTDVPFALFGHSLGASLAHEVALRLRALGAPRPAALLVSGRRAPHLLVPRPVYTHGDDAIMADVRRLGEATAAALDDPELRELVLPAIRADYRVVGTYVPPADGDLDVPVVAYLGDQDPDITVEQARAWSTVTSAGFALRVFPGDHFYLRRCEDELVADVATRLSSQRRLLSA